MDMTIPREGSLWQRLRSRQAFTSVSHIFVMEWAAVIRDVRRPVCRTVKCILAAGAEAQSLPATTGDGGAAAFLPDELDTA